MEDDDGIILKNFVQGKLWKEKIKPLFVDEFVLPIIIYYDDFETADAGTHMCVNKIGAVYFCIPCLPPEYQSSLKNIFPTLMFYVEDKKSVSNFDVFRVLTEEINYLESTGITVSLASGEQKIVKFALSLVIGDNFGINSILEFVESFSAHHYCRV